jgi:AhpD family alkylhydroperoxidase
MYGSTRADQGELYVAISASNPRAYCIASHTASARRAGMTPAQFAELMAEVGMANETNAPAGGYRVEIDERFKQELSKCGVDAGTS